MGSLGVLFEVPYWIEKGLASGTLQRVGGVVVESGSKQVVAWLRDGSNLNAGMNIASNASPLGLIMNAARSAVTLYDGHLTRGAVNAVGSQVAQVAQQVNLLTVISSFTVAGQMLNLGLSAASFLATIKRLDKLADGIALLSEKVQSEFSRDREIQFTVALQNARDVFESDNENQRELARREAVSGLLSARQNFLEDFETAMSGEISDDNLSIAWHKLIRALYADTIRIRCYAVADDLKHAIKLLGESIALFKLHSRTLVSKLLGNHPAIIFHKSFLPEDLDRFLQVKYWLEADDDASLGLPDARKLFGILNELRTDFWNDSLVKDVPTSLLSSTPLAQIQQLNIPPVDKFHNRIAKFQDRLAQAEIVIENYQRLLGFDLELRSLHLSTPNSTFHDWENLISDEDIAEYGLGIVYDAEVVESLSHLQ